jgi:hypothetical protein
MSSIRSSINNWKEMHFENWSLRVRLEFKKNEANELNGLKFNTLIIIIIGKYELLNCSHN